MSSVQFSYSSQYPVLYEFATRGVNDIRVFRPPRPHPGLCLRYLFLLFPLPMPCILRPPSTPRPPRRVSQAFSRHRLRCLAIADASTRRRARDQASACRRSSFSAPADSQGLQVQSLSALPGRSAASSFTERRGGGQLSCCSPPIPVALSATHHLRRSRASLRLSRDDQIDLS